MVGSNGVPLQESADAMVGGCSQDGLASNLCSKVKKSHFLLFLFFVAGSMATTACRRPIILGTVQEFYWHA